MLIGVARWWGTILFCLFIMLVSSQTTNAETVRNLSLQLDAGYRMDALNWTIAGSLAGTSPNILSELSWDDLEIYQLGLQSELDLERPDFKLFSTVLKGSVSYGWLVDGDNRDSDYAGDNRTLEFSRSINQTDEDSVLDTSAGIGFRFRFLDDTLSVTPCIGYSYRQQNLNLTDGTQVVGTASVSDLNSTYETEWNGPWVGIEVIVEPTDTFNLFGLAEYHTGNYQAEANWNLRNDLAHPVSFTHDADYAGVTIEGGMNYKLSEEWSAGLTLKYHNWDTDSGTDRTFFADGTTALTRLNEVNWESRSVMLGLRYSFY